MAAPPRIVRIACALGIAAVALFAVPSGPAFAQDVTVSMVPVTDPTSTTIPGGTTSAPASTAQTTAGGQADDGQTVVEAEPATATRLASENRRVLAAIGGLLIVALAISLLTIRYWRATTPVPERPTSSPAPTPAAGNGEALAEEVRRTSRRAVAGADHASADDDYEPQGTGEHDVVDVSAKPPIVRPGTAARRRALEASAEA